MEITALLRRESLKKTNIACFCPHLLTSTLEPTFFLIITGSNWLHFWHAKGSILFIVDQLSHIYRANHLGHQNKSIFWLPTWWLTLLFFNFFPLKYLQINEPKMVHFHYASLGSSGIQDSFGTKISWLLNISPELWLFSSPCTVWYPWFHTFSHVLIMYIVLDLHLLGGNFGNFLSLLAVLWNLYN